MAIAERGAGEAISRPLAGALWNRAYVLLCLVIFLGYAHNGLLTPLIPLYITDAGGSAVLAGFVLAAFSVASFLIRFFMGYWTDTWSVYGILAIGTLLLGFNSFVFIAPLLLVWFLANAGRGVGWAALNTAGYVALAHAAPPARRGEASGYYTLATNTASAFAPAISLWLLASTGSFNLVFALAGAVALVGGLFIFQMPRLARRAAPADEPVRRLSPQTLIDRNVVLVALLMGCITVTTAANTAFVPLYARHLGIDNAGPYFIASGLASIVLRLLLGRFLDRGSRGLWTALGYGTLMLGFFLLVVTQNLGMLVLAGIVLAAGHSISSPTLMAVAMDRADPRRPGAAMATFSQSYQIGAGVGAPVAGALLEGFGYEGMYLGAMAAMGLGMALTAANWGYLRKPVVGSPAVPGT